jgi:leucyl aminopeptidase
MKYDMSGAAVVLGVMEAIARLKPKVNVVGIMALAENAIGGGAYLPSDVIKTGSGTTVEVANTDAEGRLVLADALYHAQQFKPDYIVDFATLTGAVIMALGSVCAAVLGNDQELLDTLIAHGTVTGERLWQLPLWEEYEEDIASKIADIKNLGYKREAGTITAANFLQQFVGEVKWAHLDIAGTAMIERPRHFTENGGTGFGVRLIVDWLMTIGKP